MGNTPNYEDLLMNRLKDLVNRITIMKNSETLLTDEQLIDIKKYEEEVKAISEFFENQ